MLFLDKDFFQTEVYKIEEKTNFPLSIFVEDKNSVFLNTNDEDFLRKILKAVGQDLGKIELINIVNLENTDNSTYLSLIKSSKIISFGVDLDTKGNLYTLQNQNKQQILLAESLRQIAQSQEKKKLLWSALKQLFAS